MRKKRLLTGFLILVLAGCSSAASPTAVIEGFIADAEKGDVDAMNKAFSKQALNQKGDEIRSNNTRYSEMIREVGSKERATMFAKQEKIEGDKALVSFNYGSSKNGAGVGRNTGCTAFEMVKEDGEWKIKESVLCP